MDFRLPFAPRHRSSRIGSGKIRKLQSLSISHLHNVPEEAEEIEETIAVHLLGVEAIDHHDGTLLGNPWRTTHPTHAQGTRSGPRWSTVVSSAAASSPSSASSSITTEATIPVRRGPVIVFVRMPAEPNIMFTLTNHFLPYFMMNLFGMQI